VAILIKNATILGFDSAHGAEPFAGDVLIDGDRIASVGTGLEHPGAEVLDGRDHLVMPGLTNAHSHSWENFFKGRYDNLPLELWMLYSYPILGLKPLPNRLIYLRTMLSAMDSLKSGVTNVLDDVLEMPGQSLEQLDAVFQAYEDVGIRANCSGHIINRTFTDTVPYLNEVLPKELIDEVKKVPVPSTQEFLDFANEAISRFHGRAGRLRYVIAPSGPQRCTEDMLLAADEISKTHGLTYHIHILETKVQAVTGREFYGKTLIRYMHDLGALNERTTIAHSVWVTDDDIELMAQSGCSISHNPISNMKLIAGIAPFRKLWNAGVNVALGTDGTCSNDTVRVFDVMKLAALIHKVTTPDYTTGPTASEILRAATVNGARSAFIHDEVGTLEPGKKADVLLFSLKSLNFTPLNDVRNHVVYCENGSSLEKVIVNGEVVVDGGRLTRVDEESLLAEVRGYMPEFLANHAKIEELNSRFEPYFAEVHRRCAAQAIGINRWSGDEREWVVEPAYA
jgi:5-methylthioadenosine/S-adenosylhomocysteine deaminase